LKRSKTSLAVLLLSAGLSAPVAAQSAGTINGVELAEALLVAGDPAKACIVLDVVYGEATRDLDALLAYAECRQQLGDFAGASAFYRRVLTQQPQADIVADRVELLDEADAQLEMALAQAVSAATSPVPPPRLSGSVSLNRFYDSNVNGGTSSSTVDAVFAGVPLALTIAPDAKGVADSGTAIAGTINYLLPLDQANALAFRATGSASLLDEQHSESRADLGLGLGYLHGGPGYSLGLDLNGSVTLDQDGLDRATLGLDGQANWLLTDATTLSATAGVARRHVVGSDANSQWATYAGLGVVHRVTDDITAGARLVASRAAAGSASNSNWGIGPELFIQARLGEDLSVGLNYGISRLAYDDTIALFTDDRVDIRQQIGVALTYDLDALAPNLALNAAYSYSVTDSNIALYDSDRHQVSVGLSYRF